MFPGLKTLVYRENEVLRSKGDLGVKVERAKSVASLEMLKIKKIKAPPIACLLLQGLQDGPA